jgi:hypothetical protein
MPTSRAASFNIPEKLIYDLSWTGIKAGAASLEVVEDGDKIRITSMAQSAKWISSFYKVDDKVVSILTKEASSPFIVRPLNYTLKISEGRHKRDREIIFNNDLGSVTYIDHLENIKKDFPIPPNIFDPLSGFYYLRTFDLKVGRSVFVDIFDSKKIWNIEIQVLKKEKLQLPLGTFDTILIKPILKSEGIFHRKGDILIWLTDDKKRIPVMMQTKVVVGYVTATLVGGNY